MTIKCLTPEEQASLAEWYKVVATPIKELAYIYGVSARTVARVLHEHGLATPLSRRNGEACQVMDIIRKYDVEVKDLSALIVLGLQAKRETAEMDAFAQELDEFEDIPF